MEIVFGFSSTQIKERTIKYLEKISNTFFIQYKNTSRYFLEVFETIWGNKIYYNYGNKFENFDMINCIKNEYKFRFNPVLSSHISNRHRAYQLKYTSSHFKERHYNINNTFISMSNYSKCRSTKLNKLIIANRYKLYSLLNPIVPILNNNNRNSVLNKHTRIDKKYPNYTIINSPYNINKSSRINGVIDGQYNVFRKSLLHRCIYRKWISLNLSRVKSFNGRDERYGLTLGTEKLIFKDITLMHKSNNKRLALGTHYVLNKSVSTKNLYIPTVIVYDKSKTDKRLVYNFIITYTKNVSSFKTVCNHIYGLKFFNNRHVQVSNNCLSIFKNNSRLFYSDTCTNIDKANSNLNIYETNILYNKTFRDIFISNNNNLNAKKLNRDLTINLSSLSFGKYYSKRVSYKNYWQSYNKNRKNFNIRNTLIHYNRQRKIIGIPNSLILYEKHYKVIESINDILWFHCGSKSITESVRFNSVFLNKYAKPLCTIDATYGTYSRRKSLYLTIADIFIYKCTRNLWKDNTRVGVIGAHKDAYNVYVLKELGTYRTPKTINIINTPLLATTNNKNMWYGSILSFKYNDKSLNVYEQRNVGHIKPNDLFIQERVYTLNSPLKGLKMFEYISSSDFRRSTSINVDIGNSTRKDKRDTEKFDMVNSSIKKEKKDTPGNSNMSAVSKAKIVTSLTDKMIQYHKVIFKEIQLETGNVGIYYADDLLPTDNLGIDELILPHDDFNYSTFKKNIIDENGAIKYVSEIIDDKTFIVSYPLNHPIPAYEFLAKHYLDVEVRVLTYIINMYYKIWKDHIFEFGTMDMVSSMAQMLDYLYSYIYLEINEALQEQCFRVVRFIRWYAESAILRYSKYKINVIYDDLKSDLITGECKIPNKMENLYVDTTLYTIKTSDPSRDSILTLNIFNSADTQISFQTGITGGYVTVILNGASIDTYSDIRKSVEYELPKISNGQPNVIKIVHNNTNNDIMNIANVIAKNAVIKDIHTEFLPSKTAGNTVIDFIYDSIHFVPALWENQKDLIDEVIQGNAPIAEVILKLKNYYEIHHSKKQKGKRITISK